MTFRLPFQTELDMNNRQINNLAAPSSDSDATTMQWVQQQIAGINTSSIESGTAFPANPTVGDHFDLTAGISGAMDDTQHRGIFRYQGVTFSVITGVNAIGVNYDQNTESLTLDWVNGPTPEVIPGRMYRFSFTLSNPNANVATVSSDNITATGNRWVVRDVGVFVGGAIDGIAVQVSSQPWVLVAARDATALTSYNSIRRQWEAEVGGVNQVVGADTTRQRIVGAEYRVIDDTVEIILPTVTANPEGTDGDTLTRVSIGGENYNLPSGGGAGGGVTETRAREIADEEIRSEGPMIFPTAQLSHTEDIEDAHVIARNGDDNNEPADLLYSYVNIAQGNRLVTFPSNDAFADWYDKITGRFFRPGYNTPANPRSNYNTLTTSSNASDRTFTLERRTEIGANLGERGEIWLRGTEIRIPTESFRTGRAGNAQYPTGTDGRLYFVNVEVAGPANTQDLPTRNQIPLQRFRPATATVNLTHTLGNYESGHNWQLEVRYRFTAGGNVQSLSLHSDATVSGIDSNAIRDALGNAIVTQLGSTGIISAAYNDSNGHITFTQTGLGEDFSFVNVTVNYFQVPTLSANTINPRGGGVTKPTTGTQQIIRHQVVTREEFLVSGLYFDETRRPDGMQYLFDGFISHDGVMDFTVADNAEFNFDDISVGQQINFTQNLPANTALTDEQRSYVGTVISGPTDSDDYATGGLNNVNDIPENIAGFPVYRYRVQLSDAAYDYLVGPDNGFTRNTSTGAIAVVASQRGAQGFDRNVRYQASGFRVATGTNAMLVDARYVLFPIADSVMDDSELAGEISQAAIEFGGEETLNDPGVLIGATITASGIGATPAARAALEDAANWSIVNGDNEAYEPEQGTPYLRFDTTLGGTGNFRLDEQPAGDALTVTVQFHIRETEGWFFNIPKTPQVDTRFAGNDGRDGNAPTGSFAPNSNQPAAPRFQQFTKTAIAGTGFTPGEIQFNTNRISFTIDGAEPAVGGMAADIIVDPLFRTVQPGDIVTLNGETRRVVTVNAAGNQHFTFTTDLAVVLTAGQEVNIRFFAPGSGVGGRNAGKLLMRDFLTVRGEDHFNISYSGRTVDLSTLVRELRPGTYDRTDFVGSTNAFYKFEDGDAVITISPAGSGISRGAPMQSYSATPANINLSYARASWGVSLGSPDAGAVTGSNIGANDELWAVRWNGELTTVANPGDLVSYGDVTGGDRYFGGYAAVPGAATTAAQFNLLPETARTVWVGDAVTGAPFSVRLIETNRVSPTFGAFFPWGAGVAGRLALVATPLSSTALVTVGQDMYLASGSNSGITQTIGGTSSGLFRWDDTANGNLGGFRAITNNITGLL